MSLYVMKFGGSSVGDTERMKRVAGRCCRKSDEGHQCVVVVSAMGDTTDDLIDQAKQLNSEPPAREMDMLLTTGEQISMLFVIDGYSSDLDVRQYRLQAGKRDSHRAGSRKSTYYMIFILTVCMQHLTRATLLLLQDSRA